MEAKGKMKISETVKVLILKMTLTKPKKYIATSNRRSRKKLI